eukprot:gene15741-21309_t
MSILDALRLERRRVYVRSLNQRKLSDASVNEIHFSNVVQTKNIIPIDFEPDLKRKSKLRNGIVNENDSLVEAKGEEQANVLVKRKLRLRKGIVIENDSLVENILKGDVQEQSNSLTMMDDDKKILTMEAEVVVAEIILTEMMDDDDQQIIPVVGLPMEVEVVEQHPFFRNMPSEELLILERLRKKLLQKEVDAANKILSGPDNNEVVIDKFKIGMTRHKIKCLAPGAWVNDEVINFYMCMLQARDGKLCRNYPSRVPSYFFNSHFITKLLICDHGYTYKNVKRWSNIFDIFAVDKIFFPVHINESHWAMAVVYMRKKRICYYDSLSCDGRQYLEGLMQWIKDEGTHKKGGMVVDESEWELSQEEPNVPQQKNGFDCGVFSLLCADFISDDLPLRYSQIHMKQFRVKTAAAILRGEFKYLE